ncbi:MAG: hypothetical protein SFY56_06620 [Bacteroidota bacterium]|nr:hypothetical protein [Bacteroidota bacterium]
MKTKNLKTVLMIFLLGTSKFLSSQNLEIDGRFLNETNEKIKVCYSLYEQNRLVKNGRSKKIHADLMLDKEYKLVLTKDGFVDKTIYFTTKTKLKYDFVFMFDAILKPIQSLKKDEPNEVLVYYNPKRKEFNFQKSIVKK